MASDVFVFIGVAATTCAAIAKRIPLDVAAGVPSWIVNIALRQAEFYGLPADPHRRAASFTPWETSSRFAACRSKSPIFVEPLDADTISVDCGLEWLRGVLRAGSGP